VSNALVPFQEMESMASYIVKSRLFGAKDEAQAMSLMLLAQAEGMHPMAAIQDFDIVQGRPARKTHSILARFQAAGGSVAWEEISGTRACGAFSHKQGGTLRLADSVQKATGEESLTAAWKLGVAEIRKTGDMDLYNHFKAAVTARRQELSAPADDGKTIDMPTGETDSFVAEMDAQGAQQ
jgi:hypothetical protein